MTRPRITANFVRADAVTQAMRDEIRRTQARIDALNNRGEQVPVVIGECVTHPNCHRGAQP